MVKNSKKLYILFFFILRLYGHNGEISEVGIEKDLLRNPEEYAQSINPKFNMMNEEEKKVFVKSIFIEKFTTYARSINHEFDMMNDVEQKEFVKAIFEAIVFNMPDLHEIFGGIDRVIEIFQQDDLESFKDSVIPLIRNINNLYNFNGLCSCCAYFPTFAHLAASIGAINILNYLIAQGINLSIIDNRHCNVLHVAVKEKQLAIIEFLLKNKKIDVNSVNRFCQNALLISISQHRFNKLIFECLIQYGINVLHKDNFGNSALHYIVMVNQVENNDKIYVITTVLQKGLDINCKNNEGKTPLDIAEESATKNIFSGVEDAETKKALVEYLKSIGAQRASEL